jgi:hypothetical protein
MPAVLGFSFLNSMGTGVVTSGIYFLTAQGYAFTQRQNYLFGVALGVTYIVGALAAAPALEWLIRRSPAVSSRGVLATLMIVMAALCAAPLVSTKLAHGTPPAWPVWLMAIAYSPLTGVLWPMVESFISGGRKGPALRSAIGTWNVVWSGALVVAFWGVAPFMRSPGSESARTDAAVAIMLLGAIHLLAAVILPWFPSEPPPHPDNHQDPDEPHPPSYQRLLTTFRILLPASYVVSSALAPFLPASIRTLAEPMGIQPAWFTVLATAWLLPRAAAFLLLERWHGWHGRWAMPLTGGALLLVGFAGSVLASRLATGPVGLVTQLAALAAFGVGMGAIYAGAIYYAMEVGRAEVQAGGKHEALIGVGYTIGPLCGLGASVAVGHGPGSPFEYLVLGAVGLIALASAGAAGWRAWLAVTANPLTDTPPR